MSKYAKERKKLEERKERQKQVSEKRRKERESAFKAPEDPVYKR